MFSAPPRILGTPGFRNLAYVQSKTLSNTDSTGAMCGPDGTRLILGLDPSGGDIQNWTMSTPFDVSTLSLASQVAANGDFPFATGDFNPDGTEMVYFDPQNNRTLRVSLSTPYVFRNTILESPATTSLFGTSGFSFSTYVGIQWTDGGTKLLVAAGVDSKISIGTVTTPYTFSGYSGTAFSDSLLPLSVPANLSMQLITIDGIRYCLMINRVDPEALWLIAVEDALVSEDPSLVRPVDSVVLTDYESNWGTTSGQICGARDGSKLIAVSNGGPALEFTWLQQGR